MTENNSSRLQIKFTPINVLLILIVITLLGWLMFSISSVAVGKNVKNFAIAGVSYLIIESVTTSIILKLKRIKSKDDYSQLSKFVMTEYQNVNKKTLSTIFILPNVIYSLILLITTFVLQSDLRQVFYWTFVLSICYLVFNIFRALKLESVG